MHVRKRSFLPIPAFLFTLIFISTFTFAATPLKTELLYKKINKDSLKLHIYQPENRPVEKPCPAIVFFFGGGWKGGNPAQFFPHCEYLASRGMVAVSAEYRVRNRHGTTPFECVKDGKSAIRWLRQHAEEFDVDPNRIAAGGGSAGGHVAAATGIVTGLDEPDEDQSVSSKPDALVLFNPVYDNGPHGYGYDRVKDRFMDISPLHNIQAQNPPTIVFLGTNDHLIPVATARLFKTLMEEAGNRCDLFLYKEQQHGFFNYRKGENPYYNLTVYQMDRFLTSLGYLKESPTIPLPNDPDPNRFSDEIGDFEQWDQKNQVPKKAILFVGSSSIRMWKSQMSIPQYKVLNRGFGGSHISDVNHYIESIVLKHRPRMIVFYAGDNDVAYGKTTEQVFEDYKFFVDQVETYLPETKIIYLPIKPSLKRWDKWQEMEKTNSIIQSFSNKHDNLFYADTATPMLTAEGKPNPDLFLDDGLHLNDEGYELWTLILAPLLTDLSRN